MPRVNAVSRLIVLFAMSFAVSASVAASSRTQTPLQLHEGSIGRSNLPVYRESADWRSVVRDRQPDAFPRVLLVPVALGDAGLTAFGWSPSLSPSAQPPVEARPDTGGPSTLSAVASTIALALFFFLRRTQ